MDKTKTEFIECLWNLIDDEVAASDVKVQAIKTLAHFYSAPTENAAADLPSSIVAAILVELGDRFPDLDTVLADDPPTAHDIVNACEGIVRKALGEV